MKILPHEIRELKYLKTIKYNVDLYLIDETYKKMQYGGIEIELCVG